MAESVKLVVEVERRQLDKLQNDVEKLKGAKLNVSVEAEGLEQLKSSLKELENKTLKINVDDEGLRRAGETVTDLGEKLKAATEALQKLGQSAASINRTVEEAAQGTEAMAAATREAGAANQELAQSAGMARREIGMLNAQIENAATAYEKLSSAKRMIGAGSSNLPSRMESGFLNAVIDVPNYAEQQNATIGYNEMTRALQEASQAASEANGAFAALPPHIEQTAGAAEHAAASAGSFANGGLAAMETGAQQSAAAFSNAREALSRFINQTSEGSRLAQIMGDSLGNIFVKMAAWQVAGWVVSSVIGLLRTAVDQMKDVDTELTNIAKVSNMTTAELNSLGDAAYDVASRYGVAAEDFLSAVYTFQKAGLGDSAEKLGELAIKTELVGDTTALAASKFLIATNAAWELNGSYSALSRIVDEADYINNQFATDLPKIADGMTIVAATAANMNMSVEETMAAIGTITARTQETGTKAATALRALLMNITGEIGTVTDEFGETITVTEESVKSITDALKIYGNEAVRAAAETGKVIDPMEAMLSLAEAYRDGLLTEAELMNIMIETGGKLRANQLTALIKDMASDASIYREMLEGMADAAGTADAEIGVMLTSWESKLNILQNTFTKFVSHLTGSDGVKFGLDVLIGALRLADNEFVQFGAKVGMVTAAVSALLPVLAKLAASNLVTGVAEFFLLLTSGAEGAAIAVSALGATIAASPVAWIALAAAAIFGISAAVDALNVSYEEQLQIVADLNREYENQFGYGSEYARLKENVAALTSEERARLEVLEAEKKAAEEALEAAEKLAEQKWLDENTRGSGLSKSAAIAGNDTFNADGFEEAGKRVKNVLEDVKKAVREADDAFEQGEQNFDLYREMLGRIVNEYSDYRQHLQAAKDAGIELTESEEELLRVLTNLAQVFGRLTKNADEAAKAQKKVNAAVSGQPETVDDLAKKYAAVSAALQDFTAYNGLTQKSVDALDGVIDGLIKTLYDEEGHLTDAGKAALKAAAGMDDAGEASEFLESIVGKTDGEILNLIDSLYNAGDAADALKEDLAAVSGALDDFKNYGDLTTDSVDALRNAIPGLVEALYDEEGRLTDAGIAALDTAAKMDDTREATEYLRAVSVDIQGALVDETGKLTEVGTEAVNTAMKLASTSAATEYLQQKAREANYSNILRQIEQIGLNAQWSAVQVQAMMKTLGLLTGNAVLDKYQIDGLNRTAKLNGLTPIQEIYRSVNAGMELAAKNADNIIANARNYTPTGNTKTASGGGSGGSGSRGSTGSKSGSGSRGSGTGSPAGGTKDEQLEALKEAYEIEKARYELYEADGRSVEELAAQNEKVRGKLQSIVTYLKNANKEEADRLGYEREIYTWVKKQEDAEIARYEAQIKAAQNEYDILQFYGSDAGKLNDQLTLIQGLEEGLANYRREIERDESENFSTSADWRAQQEEKIENLLNAREKERELNEQERDFWEARNQSAATQLANVRAHKAELEATNAELRKSPQYAEMMRKAQIDKNSLTEKELELYQTISENSAAWWTDEHQERELELQQAQDVLDILNEQGASVEERLAAEDAVLAVYDKYIAKYQNESGMEELVRDLKALREQEARNRADIEAEPYQAEIEAAQKVLETMEQQGATGAERIEQINVIVALIDKYVAWLETQKGKEEEINDLLETRKELVDSIPAARMDDLEAAVSAAQSELDLARAKWELDEENIDHTEEEVALLRDIVAAQNAVYQEMLATNEEAGREVYTAEQMNAVLIARLGIEKEITDALERQAEARRKAYESAVSFQKNILGLMSALLMSDEEQLEQVGNISKAYEEQIAYLQEAGATQDEMLAVLTDYVSLKAQELDIQDKIAEAAEAEAEAERQRLEQQKELDQKYLSDTVALRQSELTLIEKMGGTTEERLAKLREIAAAMVEQGRALEENGASQITINQLAASYLDVLGDIRDLEEQIADEVERQAQAEIDRLEKTVALRASQVALAEKLELPLEEQLALLRMQNEALIAQGRKMEESGSSLTEINRLALTQLELQEKISEVEERIARGQTLANEEELDYLKSVLTLHRSQLNLLQAMDADDEKLVAKYRQILTDIEQIGEQMQKMGASQAELNDQAAEWYNTLKSILNIQQKQLDELAERARDYIDEQEKLELDALNAEIEALKERHDRTKEAREEEEKILAVQKARIALQNAQRNRNVRVFNKELNQWEWMADPSAVEQAEKSLRDAENDLAEYRAEKEYQKALDMLERQVDFTEKSFDALREAIDDAAEAIRKGEMSFDEAYSYITGRMRGIYEEYGVNLTNIMNEAVKGFEDVSHEIEDTYDLIHKASLTFADTAGEIARATEDGKQKLELAFGDLYGALTDVNGNLANANQTLALSFGSLNGTLNQADYQLQTAAEHLRTSAELLATIPSAIQSLIQQLLSSAGSTNAQSYMPQQPTQEQQQEQGQQQGGSSSASTPNGKAWTSETDDDIYNSWNRGKDWQRFQEQGGDLAQQNMDELHRRNVEALQDKWGFTYNNGVWSYNGNPLWDANGPLITSANAATYDEGGILTGLGGIKATERDEAVLDPDTTAKLVSRRGNEAVEAGVDLISKLYDVGPQQLRENIAERGIVLGGKPERVDDVNRGRVVKEMHIGTQINADGLSFNLTREQADTLTVSELMRMVEQGGNGLAML